MELFGLSINKIDKAGELSAPLSPPRNDDGAQDTAPSIGALYYGVYLDSSGSVQSEFNAIQTYRQLAQYPEIDIALQDIVNETIPHESDSKQIKVTFEDEAEYSDQFKHTITEEFETVLELLDYNSLSSDIFRQWYVDGRLAYQILVDKEDLSRGIVELRAVEALKLRKVREIQKTKTPSGVDAVTKIDEYYLFNDAGFATGGKTGSSVNTNQNSNSVQTGIKISQDAIIYVPSGVTDTNGTTVVSYLHKAIRPINQLRMMEDAMVVTRIARAPERRMFYIDVGSLPKAKAEQYVKDIMNQYRNKMVYDSATGSIRDDKKYMSMLEDFWLPRRDGCFTLDTKVALLDGRDVEIGQLIVEHQLGKINWTYSVDPSGNIVPGKISWAGVTRNNAKIMEVHLDNGKTIRCTPDHKFILRNGEKIEAQHLNAGASLMPFYTQDKHLMYNNKAGYTQVQNNKTGKWEFVHRLVSTYINGMSKNSEVVHHANMDRYDNSPDNLVIMDKVAHFDLHSTMGTNSWKNGDYDAHCKNLSESGKAFFDTEAGIKRKQEISEFNASCEKVWAGLQSGRNRIKEMRDHDRTMMTKEEYLKKWSAGLEKMINSTVDYSLDQRNADKANMSDADFKAKWYKNMETRKVNHKQSLLATYDIEAITNAIKSNFDKKMRLDDVLLAVNSVYAGVSKKKFRKILEVNGYDSISYFMYRQFGDAYKNIKHELKKENHVVVKTVMLDYTEDVGTLTIDEDHEYHDYHNFALTDGVFVMNSKGTQIETLPGAQNLDQITDVTYFKELVYQALNIPMSRLQQEGGFSLGRSTEVTRDEVKFQKFIDRLRRKFSKLFYDALKTQLILKGICNNLEWEEIRQNITFEFQKDNEFSILKEMEVLQTKLGILQQVDQYLGKYFSKEYVNKTVLRFTDEEIERMQEQINNEVGDPTAQPTIPGMPMGGDPSMMQGGDPTMQQDPAMQGQPDFSPDMQQQTQQGQ